MFQVVGTDGLARRWPRGQGAHAGARVTPWRSASRVRVRYEVAGGRASSTPTTPSRRCPAAAARDRARRAGETKRAIAAVNLASAGKIGLQFKRRFWESEGIYGGISRTSLDITQILYPSSGYSRARAWSSATTRTARRPRRWGSCRMPRLARAIEQVPRSIRTAASSSRRSPWRGSTSVQRGGWAQYRGAAQGRIRHAAAAARRALSRRRQHVVCQRLDGRRARSARTVARRVHERASRELGTVTARA